MPIRFRSTAMPVKKRSSTTVKLSRDRRIALPRVATDRLRLRPGTSFEIFVRDSAIIVVPTSRIPKSQRWFWTDEWQAKEREVDAAIARGDMIGPFDNTASAIHALRSS